MSKATYLIVLVLATSSLIALPRRVASADKKSGRVEGRFVLSSSAFIHQGDIPEMYTCDGKDISPELQWANAPAETKSYVIVFHDPDALGGPWNHWVVINIPGNHDHIDQQVDVGAIGATICTNSWEEQKYSGPCPPLKEHRYIFTIYALDIPKLPLKQDARRKQVVAAMQGHILAQAELMGRYQRLKK